ncbi:MAG: DUF4926 domain-containing protein [Chloroflexi bacterium]|nr:DUF4926 domain-containing protein [Chloroflexota bacterium]
MITEHERVVLTADLPQKGLKAGDVGVVVLIHDEGAGNEVEIFTLDGRTLDVITVVAAQVRVVDPAEVMHVHRAD